MFDQISGKSAKHAESLAAAAAAYAEEIGARAAEIEALRKLPQDLANRLAADQLYNICNPAEFGGPAGTPRIYAEVVETLSRADASVGWCSFISTTSAISIASANTVAVRDLLGEPGVITAGVFAPVGRARKAVRDGVPGYLASGRWAWGSGSQNARWISGGCLLLDDDGKILKDERGAARNITMIFAAEDVEFLDTWEVMGLQGTGSTDFQVTDVFVPADRTIDRYGRRMADAAIFRFPAFGILAIGIAAVALGAARAAIEDFDQFAGTKVPQGNSRTLAEKPATQKDVARAEAAIRAGRAFFFEEIDLAWAEALAGEVSTARRRDLRLAITNAVQSAKTAVDIIHELAGGTSVYRRSPLQRRFRDIHVTTQHLMVNQSTYETVGRLLLGLDTNIDQL
jgi:alkylation response protein AidB-like acyl-CoA dehydrogenase